MGEFAQGRRATPVGTAIGGARVGRVSAEPQAHPRSRALARMQRAFDQSPRVVSQAGLAGVLAARAPQTAQAMRTSGAPPVHVRMQARAAPRLARAPGPAGAVVQRVAVQIVADDEGEIETVEIGGRAGSLWPQERHHTTPWQVYLDTINGELSGLSLSEGVLGMNALDDHLRTLPGWGLVDSLEQNKQDALQAEIATLQNRRQQANAVGEHSPVLALALQSYINAWINVRSKLPLAQANFGGEAGTVADDAAAARTANNGGVVDDDALRAALLDMFDFGTVADVLTHEGADEENDPDEYTAFGLDPENTTESLDELRELAFAQHARSIRRAYPTAFDQIFDSIDDMVATMEERWGQGAAAESEDDVVMSESE